MTSYLSNLTSSQNEKKKLITMLILQLRIFFTLLHFVSELQEKRENDDKRAILASQNSRKERHYFDI